MMNIRLAKMEEKREILEVYNSLKGTYGCTWHDDYPIMDDVENDIKKDALFVIEENEKIIAVASAGDVGEPEESTLEEWSKEIKNPCTLARIGVKKEYQNKGLAKILINYIEKEMQSRGFDGMHFLVSKTNPSALAVYNKLGYIKCGESDLYDFDWFLYEKKF